MELTEDQLLQLRKYSKMGMLDYLSMTIEKARQMVAEAQTKEDLEKIDEFLNEAIHNYNFYNKQLAPENYFQSRQR